MNTRIFDYDTPGVENGAVTEIEVVQLVAGFEQLIGWGRVEWAPDSSTLIEGEVEIW